MSQLRRVGCVVTVVAAAAVVLGSIVVLALALLSQWYFEPTSEALHRAAAGRVVAAPALGAALVGLWAAVFAWLAWTAQRPPVASLVALAVVVGLIAAGVTRYERVQDPIPRWRARTAGLRLPPRFSDPRERPWGIKGEPAYVVHWRATEPLDRACDSIALVLRKSLGWHVEAKDDPQWVGQPVPPSAMNTYLCDITALHAHDWVSAAFDYEGKGKGDDHRPRSERMTTGLTLTWRLLPKTIGWL